MVRPYIGRMNTRLLISLIVVLYLAAFSTATLAPPDKSKKNKQAKELKVNKGPVDRSVFERDLIHDEPTSESILRESGTYYKNTTARRFAGPTLGFVTPVNRQILFVIGYILIDILLLQWNNHGYDVAKIFGAKFDIISPVWLQVIKKGKQKFDIGGTHDVDDKWIQDVRRTGPKKSKLLHNTALHSQ